MVVAPKISLGVQTPLVESFLSAKVSKRISAKYRRTSKERGRNPVQVRDTRTQSVECRRYTSANVATSLRRVLRERFEKITSKAEHM